MPTLNLSISNASFAVSSSHAKVAESASYLIGGVPTPNYSFTSSYLTTASFNASTSSMTVATASYVAPTPWKVVSSSYALQYGDKIIPNGVITLTLPTSSGTHKEIDLLDGFGTWGTNNVTVAGKVNGTTNLTLNINGSWTKLTDVSGSVGWRSI